MKCFKVAKVLVPQCHCVFVPDPSWRRHHRPRAPANPFHNSGMALIRVTNVRVQNSNPCQFQDPFRFEITFDCLPPGIKEGTFVPLAQPNRTHSRLWETRPITIGSV